MAVKTDGGHVVVKRYRPQWSLSTVRCGHSILLRLEALDFPTVRLRRKPDGSTTLVRDGGVFAVFDYLPGVNYSLSYLRRPDRLYLTSVAASTLARFHRCLQGFDPDGDHHLGLRSFGGPRYRDRAWHESKIGELTTRTAALPPGPARELSDAFVARTEGVVDEIDRLDEELAEARLPTLVIHGDYGLHNLIFQAGRAVPVDYEASRLDWRVNDLISVLGKYRYASGNYDFESMRVFVLSYAATFGLVPTERELLPAAWRLHKLRAAVQYWNSFFDTNGPVRKLESAHDALDQAGWVADEPEMVGWIGHVASEATAGAASR